ncbi:putative uncharacterized protein GUCA1ANB isoform X2 [Triplophysa rosa]|uniref:putative uncharacterized protein GUCA1ANB isoform X2 n=1 Tax=Triplophysa rosa TaxID=992332 RepID=UPI0025462214|nr:putative uncharacterized protein GUCA1ANB isoform X2 [Triplophysa rosa]
MMNSAAAADDDVMEPQDVMVSLASGVPVDVSSDGEVTDAHSRHYSSLNSLRPFYTAQKPTCGYSFSWDTDHRHKPTGLQPHNPAMWRNTCVYKH